MIHIRTIGCFRILMAWVVLCALAPAMTWAQDWKADIGWTSLSQELGSAMPTGAGISVDQTEARYQNTDGSIGYSPNVTGYPGKTFTLLSGPSVTSAHANIVAYYMFGTVGIAPGITNIYVHESRDWLYYALGGLSLTEPVAETARVLNASWIDSIGDTYDKDFLRRFDYQVNRDGYFAAVGANNGSTTSVPRLMDMSYNAMVVGVSSGDHSHGYTNLDKSGRIKPDIVAEAPTNLTSYATAVVSGAAAMMLQVADANSALVDARHHSEVIRSIFMSGARKDVYSDWDRTPTRPLDDIYGAGLLNVANSYHILTAGEQHSSNAQTVGLLGWDYSQSTSAAKVYYIDVPAGSSATLSTSLNWNRVVADGDPGASWQNPTASVANMSLSLYEADSGFGLGRLVDQSISNVDNVELIYNHTLTPGRYALAVTSATPGNNFALSWQATLGALLPGDMTGDGNVNFTDYLVLEQNFGQPGRWSQGDVTGDGMVNFSDYLVLEQNFGTSLAGGQANSLALTSFDTSGGTVPEPATVCLLLAGAQLFIRRLRRLRR